MNFSNNKSRQISLGGASSTKSREQLIEQARQERQLQQQRKRENDAAKIIVQAFRKHTFRSRWKNQLRQEWDRDVSESGQNTWNNEKLLLSLTRRLLLFISKNATLSSSNSVHTSSSVTQDDWRRFITLSKFLFVNMAKKSKEDDPHGPFLSKVDGYGEHWDQHHARLFHMERLLSLWCSYIAYQSPNVTADRDAKLFVRMIVLCLDPVIYTNEGVYQQLCIRTSHKLFHCLAKVIAVSSDEQQQQQQQQQQLQQQQEKRELITLASTAIKRLLTLNIQLDEYQQFYQWKKNSAIVGSAFVHSFLTEGMIVSKVLGTNDDQQLFKIFKTGLSDGSALAKIVLGANSFVTSAAFLSSKNTSLANLLLNLVDMIKFHLQLPQSQYFLVDRQIFEEYLEIVGIILHAFHRKNTSMQVDIDAEMDEDNQEEVIEMSDVITEEVLDENSVAKNVIERLMTDRQHAESLFSFVRDIYERAEAEREQRKQNVAEQKRTISPFSTFGGGGFGGSTATSSPPTDTTRDTHVIVAFTKLYHILLSTKITGNDYLRGQLMSTLTFGFGLSSRGFLRLLFGKVFGNDAQSLDAELLSMFSRCYTHVLAILDDDEFHGQQIPFTHEQNTQIASVVKDICFDLYWDSQQPQQQQQQQQWQQFDTMVDESLRGNLTNLLTQLHSRDSRRRFIPLPYNDNDGQNTFWWIKETAELDYSSLRVEEWSDNDIDGNDRNITSPLPIDDYEMMARYTLGQRRMISLRHGMRAAPVSCANATKVVSQKHQALKQILKNIPFVIPFSVRVGILHRFILQEKENLVQFHYPFTPPITIRRSYVFEDAFSQLNHMSGMEMKKQINVQFHQEEGIGVGVFKEFVTELCKQAFSPNYGLFISTTSGNSEGGLSVYPNPHSHLVSDDHLSMFEFLGKILGKSLFERLIVDVPFGRFFLSKLLGKRSFFNDLPSLDFELYRNLMFLKRYDGDVENDLSLNFAVADDLFGQTVVKPLIKNGQNVPVTRDNRLEYILRVSNYRLNTQIRKQSEAFLKGLRQIIPQQWLRMFDENELFLLICGREDEIDVNDWQRHTSYSGGYDESHPTIRMFWDVVRNDLSNQQRRLLLKFITSSRRPPLLGFGELYPPIMIQMTSDRGDLERLPSAATCINLLKLAPYKRKEDLKTKLTLAIEETEGFELT